MPEIPNAYDAVIADLELRRTQLDSAIDMMKRLKESVSSWGGIAIPIGAGLGIGSGTISGTGTITEAPFSESENIPSDAFFGMTIADAAVKYLDKWASRKPQSTNTIVDALERGGQKRSKYTTVYGILSRRAKKEGDVVNVKGDWGLRSWYGGPGGAVTRPKRKAVSVTADEPEEPKPEPPVWKPNGEASGSTGA
jgi:hypothetical protein